MSDAALTAWWDFANQKTLAPRYGLGPTLDCVRAGATGTRINSLGLVEAVAANLERFDHQPLTNKSLGLLLEETRINVALHNRDSTQAEWVKTNMTAAKDQVGEDGEANSASSLLATAGNATAIQAFTIVSKAQTGTFSIKRLIGTGDVDITIDDGVTWTTVNINSLTWTRFSRTQTLANPDIGVRLVTSGDKIAIDFQGLEAGSIPTSRIATAGSAVTRAADLVSTTDVSWLNALAGTFFIDAHVPFVDAVSRFQFSLSDNSNNNRIQMYRSGGTAHRAAIKTGNVPQYDQNNAAVWASGDSHRSVITWEENDFNAYVDGAAIGAPDTGGTIPPITHLYLGADQTGGAGNAEVCHIAEAGYYNVRKDNQFLSDQSGGLINEATGGMMATMRRRRGR